MQYLWIWRSAAAGLAAASVLVGTGCGGGSGGLSATATPPEAAGSAPASGASGGVSTPVSTTTPGDGTASGGSGGNSTPAPAAEVPTLAITMTPPLTAYTGDYDAVSSGAYVAINNNWNAVTCNGTGSQQVGLSEPHADGSVDFRVKWDYTCGGRRLLGYPEVAYGIPSTPTIPAAPGGKLPLRLGDVKVLTTRTAGVKGTADGGGYLAYDVWTSTSPDGSLKGGTAADGSLTSGFRDAEILIPIFPINGFGVPADPDEALVGREAQTQRMGWDPKAYIGRRVIGGNAYDVYYHPPAMHSQWKFISLLPLHYPKDMAHTLDWRPLLDYFMQQGWLSPDVYLANVEMGVEVYTFETIAVGDWTVKSFRVDAE